MHQRHDCEVSFEEENRLQDEDKFCTDLGCFRIFKFMFHTMQEKCNILVTSKVFRVAPSCDLLKPRFLN